MNLSIITINLNNRDGLQKTIESVLSQTWTDFEWIIIDGGSTDGSRELIEQYQEHFAYWCSEPDKGVYNAMNKGIAKAKGTYLNFMNSGDVFFEADTLSITFSQERTVDILYGDWVEKYDNREEKKEISLCDLFKSLWKCNICHQAMFIKSTLLKAKGYDESFKLLADLKWNTEALLAGKTFGHIRLVICKYDMYGMSSGKMTIEKRKERQIILSLYPDYMQYAIEELNDYDMDHYVQVVKELREYNSFWDYLARGCLNVLFLAMLIIRKITKICNLKS